MKIFNTSKDADKSVSPKSFRAAWQLTKPYFQANDTWEIKIPFSKRTIQSKEKWKARALLTTIIGLSLGQIYIDVQLNEWSNSFAKAKNALDRSSQSAKEKSTPELTAKVDQDAERLKHLFLQFSGWAALFVAGAVAQTKLQSKLGLDWQRWMTNRYDTTYLSNKTYYRVPTGENAIDNPQQRIATDIPAFTNSTLNLGLGSMQAAIALPTFAHILWNMSGPMSFGIPIPGLLMWEALAYAAGGTWIGHQIGKKLVPLNNEKQKLNADLSMGIVHIRDNKNSIAMIAGEALQEMILFKRTNRIVENGDKIIETNKRLGSFNLLYRQAATIFPYVITLDNFKKGIVDVGGYVQCASAFGQVQANLSWLFNNYGEIAEWKAVTNRLTTFAAAMEQAQDKKKLAEEGKIDVIPEGNPDSFIVKDLTILRPDGQRLIDAFSLALEPGDTVGIYGRSGCGKTTMFKAFMGVHTQGEGRVDWPAQGGRPLVLTQDTYLPLMPLKGIICYPQPSENFSDETVADALQKVGLGEHVPDLNNPEKEGDYWEKLSGGERKRLNFARAIVLKPKLVLDDESSSGLDVAAQDELYSLLKREHPTKIMLSITHGTEQKKHCNKILRIQDYKVTMEPSPTI